jgi:hypothetical protein
MQSLVIVLVLIVVFSVSSVNGDNAEKVITSPCSARRYSNSTCNLIGSFTNQLFQARKAFLGKDNKLRDDADLEKLRNHLLKISDKVIKENQGQQPTVTIRLSKYCC